MKIIQSGVEILTPIDRDKTLKLLETTGRVCYKSENLIKDGSSSKFISSIVNRGHESVIEHCSVTVRFICDRAIANEIVRHRIASFAQESTRYVNYNKDKFGSEITVIAPQLDVNSESYNVWKNSVEQAEKSYMNLISLGVTPEFARSVLPNSLKTELIMTANLREWRHFIKLRGDKAAHPDIRKLAIILLEYFKGCLPEIFGDINNV